MKLFTAENELSSKTAVSLETPLVAIDSFVYRHLECFIQDVDGDVFDQGPVFKARLVLILD